jgi:hypothetical protein
VRDGIHWWQFLQWVSSEWGVESSVRSIVSTGPVKEVVRREKGKGSFLVEEWSEGEEGSL